jgi:hypothetical protein
VASNPYASMFTGSPRANPSRRRAADPRQASLLFAAPAPRRAPTPPRPPRPRPRFRVVVSGSGAAMVWDNARESRAELPSGQHAIFDDRREAQRWADEMNDAAARSTTRNPARRPRAGRRRARPNPSTPDLDVSTDAALVAGWERASGSAAQDPARLTSGPWTAWEYNGGWKVQPTGEPGRARSVPVARALTPGAWRALAARPVRPLARLSPEQRAALAFVRRNTSYAAWLGTGPRASAGQRGRTMHGLIRRELVELVTDVDRTDALALTRAGRAALAPRRAKRRPR